MIYNLSNVYDKEKFRDKVNKLYSDGAVVELVKKNPNRTLKQNSYLHLILGYFAQEFGYSLEEVKFNIFKNLCNKDLFQEEKINKHNQKIIHIKSSSELDTRDMTIAIDRFRNYSASVCGLYIPSPDEKEAIVYAQQQVENNIKYL